MENKKQYIKIIRPNDPRDLTNAWYANSIGKDFLVVGESKYHYEVEGERSVPKDHCLLLENEPQLQGTPAAPAPIEKIVVNTEGIYVGQLAEEFVTDEEYKKLEDNGFKKEDIISFLVLFGESLAAKKPEKQSEVIPEAPKTEEVPEPEKPAASVIKEQDSVIKPMAEAANIPPASIAENKNNIVSSLKKACENLGIPIMPEDTNTTLRKKLAEHVSKKDYNYKDVPERTISPAIANKSNAELCQDLHLLTSQKVMKIEEVKKILADWGVDPEITKLNEFAYMIEFDAKNKQMIRVGWN